MLTKVAFIWSKVSYLEMLLKFNVTVFIYSCDGKAEIF